MKKFKAFTDELNDAFINGLKAYLEGVIVITSSEDGEDGDDDRNLSGNAVSKHVTRGAGISKPRASGKTPMIENLEKRMFRLEESIKDITDFVKEGRLRRAEKERQKKRDEAEGNICSIYYRRCIFYIISFTYNNRIYTILHQLIS